MPTKFIKTTNYVLPQLEAVTFASQSTFKGTRFGFRITQRDISYIPVSRTGAFSMRETGSRLEVGSSPQLEPEPIKIQNVRITHDRSIGESYGFRGKLTRSSADGGKTKPESALLPKGAENFGTDVFATKTDPEIPILTPATLAKSRLSGKMENLEELFLDRSFLSSQGAKPNNPEPTRQVERSYIIPKQKSISLPSINVVIFTVIICLAAMTGSLWLYQTSGRKVLSQDLKVAAISARTWENEFEPLQLFGHRRMAEAPLDELVPVLRDKSVLLREAAANSFLEMQRAAMADRVYLIPISGFRSIEDQRAIFYEVKRERNQKAEERAKVSAPPGYSEHHTGYALDIGERDSPETDLEFGFEHTDAYYWLAGNANRFHFEMSFPLNNEQGIAFEPWHWRYVGDIHSLQTFHGTK